MIQAVTILDACQDQNLFGKWFRDETTWRGWLVFLRALFGLPMSEEERRFFSLCTGLKQPPHGGVREAWLVIGRRGGKSRVLALIAVYLATFVDWSPYLSPGERGTVMVLAVDRKQARVIYRYARALLLHVPMLRPLVQRETQEAIDLDNSVTIEIQAANFRSIRGYTVLAALADEIAFWRSDESANPDMEIMAALRPAMATVPRAMLLCASSPYARRGVLWDAYRKHYGKPGPALVWKADTRTMNPTVPDEVLAEAYERDPASAAAEYGAEFRSDVETFVSREVVDAAVAPGRHELPPLRGQHYVGFVDPSGGSADSMTCAVAHLDRSTNRVVLDALRERKPPFSPEAVAEEFAALLRSYGISRITGDRYAGEWPREQFRKHGVDYQPAENTKSDLYRELLPLLNSGRAELLDSSRLVSQLCSIERRTARGGRDSIDHPPNAHDDVANAAAGALVYAVERHAVVITPEVLARARVHTRRPVRAFFT